MTPYLSAPNDEFDRLVRRTPPGMMFWAGTCTDPKATCGGCQHFGYSVPIRNSAGNALETREYPSRCALFNKHTKEHSKKLPAGTPACRYFEPKKP